MPEITIGDLGSVDQYVALEGQTEFTITFPWMKDSWINVYVGDSEEPLSGGYTLDGAGQSTGGTLTFDSGLSAGTVVTIRRKIPIQRDSNFSDSGFWTAKNVNNEFNKIVMLLQQLEDTVERSPLSKIFVNKKYTLPLASAGRALLWNEDGTNLENSSSDFNSIVPEATAQAEVATEQAELADTARTAAETAQGQAEQARDDILEDVDFQAVAHDLTNTQHISTVSQNIINVNKVADNEVNVNKVADIDTNVTKVADIDANVTKVADIDANVTKVADNEINVNKVADNEINVNKVADIDANVTKVADIDANVVVCADNIDDIKNASALIGDNLKSVLTEDTMFTVHHSNPEADYTSFAEASYDLYNKYYPKATDGGITVEIKALTGHIETIPLHIKNGIDMGWFRWTSVDATVPIDPRNSTVTEWFKAEYNAIMPVIGCYFDMQTYQNSASERVVGFYVYDNSRMLVLGGAGIQRCSNCSLIVAASQVTVERNAVALFITSGDSSNRNVLCTDGGILDLQSSNCQRVIGTDNITDICIFRGARITHRSTGEGGYNNTVNTLLATGAGYILSY